MANADSAPLPWSLDSIDLDRIDMSRVRDDETLFFVLAGASFIESGSDLYTHNLVSYYRDDAAVAGWLNEHWEQEELQHGRALRAYVERVWPEFDWSTAFQRFFDDYSQRCTVDEFEPTHALEMAARCIVETGTATLYTAINAYTDEPVLKQLSGHIRSDEVRHYKHFYQHFRQYNESERNSRAKIFGAIARRLIEIRNDDSDCALRHVFDVRYPDDRDNVRRLRDVIRRTRELVKHNLPAEMTVKMILKPLRFSPWATRGIEYSLIRLTRLALR